MEVGKLTVQRRTGTGKGVARKLRATGHIPGICYGTMLEEPIAITVEARALQGSLDPAKRRNTVIDMTIEGNGEPDRSLVVMVKDYQIDKIRRDLMHVDLYAVDTNREVQVEIPIEITGKPKGLVVGGQLHTVLHSMEVRCKPSDIPANAVLDITELDIGMVLHVSDISMPEGVSSTTSGHLAIITCTAPAAEAEAEEDEEVEPAATDEAKKEG